MKQKEALWEAVEGRFEENAIVFHKLSTTLHLSATQFNIRKRRCQEKNADIEKKSR
jgi:hypothetical protein